MKTNTKRGRWAWFGVFVAVAILSNILTALFGLVTVVGLTATAGTWVAGLAFVARDALQERGGRGLIAVVLAWIGEVP